MKIWITRDTAISIQVGGLERLWVHFKKPKYLVELISEKDRDTPWGHHHEANGYYAKHGWEADYKMWVYSMSFGNWLGYCEEDNPERDISLYVWDKLCEHFLNKPFDEWYEMEKAGIVKQENFLLELDLNITLKQ